jgi:diguanylate cyclase (GGDEF)-like protein
VGRAAGAYFSLSGLILASSIVESSYLLAYHDELTGLPGRRAFHNALFRLGDQFVIAAVDIDHFKSFNDTYGHETGDQVLRMVAARLAKVGGGGEAFRVGGEEFLILFPGKTLSAILPYAENLRLTVEETRFRTRAITERRRVPRPDADRRKARNSTRARRAAATRTAGELSVTISIGVAAGHAGTRTPESVQQAADRALYRAKDAGRNRVEIAGPSRTRARRQIA